MYSTPVDVTLPDSFYTALDNVVDTIKEKSAEENSSSNTDFYNKNLLNYEELTFIAPKFNESMVSDYRLIGRSLMEGMADIFFNYWERYNDSEDYYKVNKEEPVKTPIEQVAPIVNVTVPENDKKEENLALEMLKLPLAALFIGINAGTSLWGQVIESITLLPKLLTRSGWLASTISSSFKGIPNIISKINGLGTTVSGLITKLNASIKGIPTFGTTIAQTMSKISGAFTKLVSFANNFNFIGTGISKVMTTAGTFTGNITNILKSKAVQLGAKIASKLKFLPFIGTVLGLYQSYLRFNRGEYFSGTLEFAAAIATLLPGPGTAIAIGINVLQGILESGSTSIGGISNLLLKSVPAIGGKLLGKLTASLSSTLLKPLSLVLKRIPLLGSLISFGMAISDFSNGENLSGSLNILSGLGGLVDIVAPGVGTAIALAIDALNIFLNATETGQNIVAKTKDIGSSIGNAISKWYNYIASIKDTVINTIIGTYHDVVTLWDNGITMVSETLTGWGESISEWYNDIKNNIVLSFNEIFTGFSISETINLVTDMSNNLITDIKTKFSTFFSTIFDSISNYFTGKISEIKQKFEPIFSFVTDMFDFSTEKSLIDSCIESIKDSFTQIWANIKNAISNWWETVTNKVTGLFDNIKASTKNLIGNIGDFFGFDTNSIDKPSGTVSNVQDVRTITEPTQQLKIDPTLVNNQLVTDKKIKAISDNITKNDFTVGKGVNKLNNVAEAILSHIINNGGKNNIITTNNIISGSGILSRTSSISSDPRLIYSN